MLIVRSWVRALDADAVVSRSDRRLILFFSEPLIPCTVRKNPCSCVDEDEMSTLRVRYLRRVFMAVLLLSPNPVPLLCQYQYYLKFTEVLPFRAARLLRDNPKYTRPSYPQPPVIHYSQLLLQYLSQTSRECARHGTRLSGIPRGRQRSSPCGIRLLSYPGPSRAYKGRLQEIFLGPIRQSRSHSHSLHRDRPSE